jgi:hypothetical protein
MDASHYADLLVFVSCDPMHRRNARHAKQRPTGITRHESICTMSHEPTYLRYSVGGSNLDVRMQTRLGFCTGHRRADTVSYVNIYAENPSHAPIGC